MNTIGAKLLDVFKNLKSDAVPKPPRESKTKANKVTIEDVTDEHLDNDENVDISNDQENIHTEEDIPKKNKKSKSKKTPDVKDSEPSSSNDVNTQATGNVWNIVGSSNVHVGNVYNLSPSPTQEKPQPQRDSENHIQKCNLITSVMEAKIKPEHEYINKISKNLGLNWQNFFRVLGYTQGQIDTFQIDFGDYGVSEVRYKLLLDWACNDDDGTLGLLATKLWEEGERQVVKELAIMYKANRKQTSVK